MMNMIVQSPPARAASDRGADRRRARPAHGGLLALATAAGLLGAAVPAAGAVTTQIGSVREVAAAEAPAAISAGGFVVQYAEAAGSYAVPFGYDTITAWSHSAGSAAGSLTFKVYRPTGGPQEFVAVAADTQTIAAGSVQTFAVDIPVQAGDRIGLSSDDVQLAYETGDTADRIGFFGTDIAPGATSRTDGDPFGEFKLDVTATLRSIPGANPPPVGQSPGGSDDAGGSAGRSAITGLRMSPAMFRASHSGPSVARSFRALGSAKVSYRIGAAGKVRFTVRRLRPGRRASGASDARCVAQTARNRRAAACTRELPLSGSFTATARAGVNSLRFTGRLGGRSLPAVSYRLVATPVGGAAPAGSAKVRFRVVR
ncbi:MAG: hypothetical protein QOG42_1807 [Solirubrobacteraceae bacterium]|nr:hypothetical protein [Solirubrobacteraceae bacterium]